MGLPTNLTTFEGNTDAQVLISFSDLKGSYKVVGHLIGEFQVGGSNEFKSLFEFSAQQTLQDMISRIGAITSSEYLANIRLQSRSQTQQSWVNSMSPSFSLPMSFIATAPDSDVRKHVKTLLKTVYPTFSGGTLDAIDTPLGYKLAGSATTGGTITIWVGRWFKAPNQLMKTVNFTFSREVINNGTPLYAVGAIEFMPYRLIGAEDIDNYLSSEELGGGV